MAKKTTARVSLVGRTNVGKSAIFNRLSNNKIKNLVLDQDNVTRDYIETLISVKEQSFFLVDTGGYSVGKRSDELSSQVNHVVEQQIENSQLLLFVCDAMSGPVEEDIRFLSFLRRKFSKNILLVVNKADNADLDSLAFQFLSLGFDTEEIFSVSAVHNKGLSKLLETTLEHIPCLKTAPAGEDSENNQFKISVVGKPNAGKSSLINHLLQEERVIVSALPGTTREAVTNQAKINDSVFELVDTAGIRRKKSVDVGLENMMVKSSLQALRTANLIILVVDASEKKLSKQDLRLLSYAVENRKNLLLVLNKADLLDELDVANLEYQLESYDFLLKKIPMVRISCLNKKNINKVRKHICLLKERSESQFDTEEVTEKIKTYLSHRPLYKKRQILKIFKARFVPGKTMGFHLYVNKPELFGKSELSCIENVLRKEYDLRGCQINFATRKV